MPSLLQGAVQECGNAASGRDRQMDSTTIWLIGCISAFAVGMGKGGVPVITATAVPLLSQVMSPVTAAGILLPVYVVADIFGLFAYRKNYHAKVLKLMLIALPIGVVIGYFTASYIPVEGITIVIGLVGAAFALTAIVGPKTPRDAREARTGPGLFWGTISGFTSFVSHAGATPFQIYALPLGMDKLTFAGTMIIAFAYINMIKLIPYYMLGQLSVSSLQTAAYLMIPAIAGVFCGIRLVRWMPEQRFFQVIVWALLVLSLRLIWQGTTALMA